MSPKPKAYVSWSSGKDCAFALWEAQRAGDLDICGLLTTTNEAVGRVAMHGTRNELMRRQAEAVGLPVLEVGLPWPCSNEDYASRMLAACDTMKAQGVSHVVYGDLFLEDIRAYRDEKMSQAGLTAVYPLWKRDTRQLARDMIASDLKTVVVCIDPKKLDPSFAGRWFDEAFLNELPDGIDPCGENGEFHTCVVDGPMFSAPIGVEVGDTVERDGFVYADVMVK
jgi:uncharacterized protein (TIGR00290 family)